MKDTNTLVSVIVPVCNAAEYLQASVLSILSQSHKNIEVIAIDDSSKDESLKILKDLQREDKRIKVYKNKKRYGLAVCFNRAVAHAKGRFITFMSPYDLSGKLRLKKQVDFLLKNPKIIGVGSQAVFIAENNAHIGKTHFPQTHEHIYQKLLTGLALQFETVVLDKHMLPKDIFKFTSNIYPFVYTEVFLKLQQYGQFANLPQYLYYRRTHEMQPYKTISGIQKGFSLFKLWIQSRSEHDYRPSLRALLQPLLSPVKTIFQ